MAVTLHIELWRRDVGLCVDMLTRNRQGCLTCSSYFSLVCATSDAISCILFKARIVAELGISMTCFSNQVGRDLTETGGLGDESWYCV